MPCFTGRRIQSVAFFMIQFHTIVSMQDEFIDLMFRNQNLQVKCKLSLIL